MYVYGAKTKCKKMALLYPVLGNQDYSNLRDSWFLNYENTYSTELFIKTIDFSVDLSDEIQFKFFVKNIFSSIYEILS